MRLKEHSITTIYRSCPATGENLNRASRPLRLGVNQPGGIPSIITQRQPPSVTLHLWSFPSTLRQVHPWRQSSGLPLGRRNLPHTERFLQPKSAVTNSPPADRSHSRLPSSCHGSPTYFTHSIRRPSRSHSHLPHAGVSADCRRDLMTASSLAFSVISLSKVYHSFTI